MLTFSWKVQYLSNSSWKSFSTANHWILGMLTASAITRVFDLPRSTTHQAGYNYLPPKTTINHHLPKTTHHYCWFIRFLPPLILLGNLVGCYHHVWVHQFVAYLGAAALKLILFCTLKSRHRHMSVHNVDDKIEQITINSCACMYIHMSIHVRDINHH